MSQNTLTIQDSPAVANLMDTGRFNQMMMIAGTMASASLIPEHLLGRKKGGSIDYYTADEIRANCFLIVNQAFRWGMDPFAVMPETYVVGGKLAYQGKLIAGVINALAGLDGRLAYDFSGTKGTDDFTITVSGKFKGADKPVSVQVSVGQAKTDNQMWRKDPEQKLVYTGATKWARRYCPEIVLGILTEDDAEQIEMREATGRVVGETAPPKVVTGGTSAAPAQTAKKRTSKSQPAQEAAPSAQEETPVAEETSPEETEVVPPRPEMVAGIRVAFRSGGYKTLPEAEARCIELGKLERGQGFSALSDEALYKIFAERETIFVPTDKNESKNAQQGGDQ